MTGVPLDDDPSSRHFRAHPVAGVALHDDLPAGHARTEVHAHGSVHHDPALCHARADLFHLGQIAREVELTVGGAPDLEELAQVGALVAVDDGELRGLERRHAGQTVRTQDICLERYRGCGPQGQGEAHGRVPAVAGPAATDGVVGMIWPLGT